MNPIEYLTKIWGYRITSDPSQYYESYNPNRGKKPWGKRDLWEWHNGRKIYHDEYCDGEHNAYDLSIKEGADVPAVVDGFIVKGTTQKGNFGGTVVLADKKGDYQYIYGHVKNITVKPGDEVKQGDKLAEQSNTNYYNNPMNSHLHFQTQPQGYIADEKTFVCSGVDPLKIDVNKYISKEVGKMPRIALDIGHGKNTFPPGKGVYRNGRGYAEFDFNNKLGKRVKRLLEHNGFDVVMAQPFDSNEVGLVQRTNFYDSQNCDAGISLHANAGASNVGGRCAFYWHSSKQGRTIATNIIKNMKSKGYGIHGNGLHASNYGSWTNLHMTRMCTTFPMVLIEHGFMTNALDFPLIFGNRQDEYINDMAETDVKGLCEYFGKSFKSLTDKPKSAPAKPSGDVLHRVQVGAFSKAKNARDFAKEVEADGYETYLAFDNVKDLYRVQVGAFGKKENANDLLAKMKKDGYKDAFIALNDGHLVNDDDADANETTAPDEKKTPYMVGEWKTNKYGTQYIEAHGTITITASRVMSRFDGPTKYNKQGGWANRGWSTKYFEMVRVAWSRTEGYIMVAYRVNGRLKYVPYRPWNPITGEVGEEWAKLS